MNSAAVSSDPIDRVELIEGYGIRWRADGEGHPILWAHDALASVDADDTHQLVDFTAIARASRLIRFDAVGHGRSAGVYDPHDHEWTTRAGTMVDLTRRFEIESVDLGGFGAGAATALFATLAMPTRVRRLVLAAPVLQWGVPNAVRRLPRPIITGGLIGSAEPMRYAGRWMPVIHNGDRVNKFLEANYRRLTRAPRNQFTAVLIGASRSRWPTIGELATVETPTLILAHRGDPTHPVSAARRLAERLPHAELVEADSAADTARWGELIADFVT